ncbi:DUF309 domain-containing protein [Synechococcus sp. UW140]|uniref:DUF309 domain-containing protein n=1 Tax=Synechococcus sp. UW140 TaxID=368503 RepID=UPI000E0F4D87|nr:DUF309 domain-containing protein [Synechococcus sp. UW140]
MNADPPSSSSDQVRTDPRFDEGVHLFNSEQWYAAHDVFEDLWHETADPERRVLQGLIQVAVAHVHLERGNTKGATILLGEGLGRLKGRSLPDFGLDLDHLRSTLHSRLAALQQGLDPASYPVPVLRDQQ